MAVKILIDGEKLGALLEAKTHKSLKELSLENGFSKNFLSEAVRCNRATAPVISVAKIYGIELESYKAVENRIALKAVCSPNGKKSILLNSRNCPMAKEHIIPARILILSFNLAMK